MYTETRFIVRGEATNYGKPGSRMLFGCDKCGAGVAEEDMTIHAKWHRQMAGIVDVVFSDIGASFSFIAKEDFTTYIQQINGRNLFPTVRKGYEI